MVAKKKSKNGFMGFVNDWKRRHPNNLSLEESISMAGIEWSKMTAEERLPYKTAALNDNVNRPPIKRPTIQEKHHLQQKKPQPQEQQQRTLTHLEEDEQKKGKRHTDRMVHDSVQRVELDTQSYYFIMVNYFAKTANSDMYQPAELAISKFSLYRGIYDVFHKLINPGPSMYGSKYETQIHASETHQLPIPPNALGDDNLEELYKEILQFMQISESEDDQSDNESQPIFTLREHIPIVGSALKYLNGGTHDFKIYSIEYLFFVLKNATCETSGLPQPKNIYETNLRFERDPYEHEADISCDYHEKRDLSKHCAKSYVIRWGFMFANYMCNDLAIRMLPNCHKPKTTRSSYMPIMDEKPKIQKEEESMQDNNVPQIKTKCPEDNNADDLWNDLNKLTDILEEEILEQRNVVIKTEINDDDDDDDNNVAPPPPPPISLGEVNDELAQFTRRMKTNNLILANEENPDSDKPTSTSAATATANPVEKQSKDTKSKTNSKERSKNSTKKSQEVSRHDRAKSPTLNRSSKTRSTSRRRVSRSKSRERKPYQRENSAKESSRHYKKSRSPRRRSITRVYERRENVSRTGRRISRSGSRECKSYRKRSFSRERSQSITRHGRRSRSRSNLRINNRSVRRSRSRSRYRYSPNRRRSSSLSPLRSQHRRRSFRERSSSPETTFPKHQSSFFEKSPSPIRRKSLRERSNCPDAPYRNPSPHIDNDQAIVPTSFTNAPPHLSSQQASIHSAASNPIPSTAASHYHTMPQHMPHGAMQYTQTTYSAQYYQAGPIRPNYGEPLLPSTTEFAGPYHMRHRLGPVVPSGPRFLNEHDLRHRIRGRAEYYQPHPYANYQNPYPPYMEAQNQYASYPLQNEYY